MTLSNFGFKLTLAALASVAVLVLPASSAPISVFPKDLLKTAPETAPVDESQITLVRAERGGARGGGAARGAAVRGGAAYRGGAVARGGAVVRGGTVVTGGGGYYAGGYCDPNYQNCGGSYATGVYPGGAAVYRGGAVVRGGAVARGGAAGGAHVAHRGGGRRR